MRIQSETDDVSDFFILIESYRYLLWQIAMVRPLINNLKAQPIAYKHNSGWMFIEYHAYAK
jgi:hypothetical protein